MCKNQVNATSSRLLGIFMQPIAAGMSSGQSSVLTEQLFSGILGIPPTPPDNAEVRR